MTKAKPETWTDNLGNEITVRPCKGITDPFMQPERVKAHVMPCVKISFASVWTQSSRTATIHLSTELAEKVIKSMKSALHKTQERSNPNV